MTSPLVKPLRHAPAPSSFDVWAARVRRQGRAPRVLVLGTLGKTTVVRLLSEIARAAGLRTAVRTDSEVEIAGRRRLGYLKPWEEAQTLLQAGALDLTVEEVDWRSVPMLAAAGAEPAAIVIATVCPDREFCRLDDTRRAIASLQAFLQSSSPELFAAIDADDTAFPTLADRDVASMGVSAIRREHPAFRGFLEAGGLGVWVEQRQLIVATAGRAKPLLALDEIPLTLGGTALFQVHNVMAATVLASHVGIPREAIRTGLRRFRASIATLPRSLNVIETPQARVLLDRASESGLLPALLRTTRTLKPERLICVLDYPPSASGDDLVEVGRMLARQASICILIDEDAGLGGVLALRAGLAQTELPPPILHAATLAKAVRRALDGARPGDLVLVLSHRPHTVHRVLARDRLASVA